MGNEWGKKWYVYVLEVINVKCLKVRIRKLKKITDYTLNYGWHWAGQRSGNVKCKA